MYGVKLSDQYIDLLRQRCNSYLQDWVSQCNSIYETKKKEFTDNYAQDLLDRGTFCRKIDRLVDWQTEQISNAQEYRTKFIEFLKNLRNRVFTEIDNGYRHIYHFKDCSVEKVKIDDPNCFVVTFCGVVMNFGFGDMDAEAEFKVDEPEFGPLGNY